jgi:hypothetical protein
MGDAKNDDLRVGFDSCLKLKFCGSKVTSDAGLLAYRELDEALGLTEMGGDVLTDSRQGRNKQHQLVPLLRQSIYSRLAGYEDVNDAERLCVDPALRHVVGGRASQPDKQAASGSEVGRFETETLSTKRNLMALIAGIGFVSYFVWLILWLLFGRTVFVATEQLLRIRKKLVFPLSSGMIHRSDLESFELMELVHVNDGREVRYWGLDANLSDSAVRLLPKEIDFETADWLGRTLAGWFGVSFARAHETEAIRSRYYEELG